MRILPLTLVFFLTQGAQALAAAPASSSRPPQQLADRLKQADGFQREGIMLELEHAKDPATLPIIMQFAREDPEAPVRIAALRALGGFRHAKIIPILCEALKDPHPLARMEAIRSLGRCQQPSALSTLVAFADNADLMAHEPQWYKEIILILGQHPDPSLIPIWIRAMDSGNRDVDRQAFIHLLRLHPQGEDALRAWAARRDQDGTAISLWKYFLGGMHDVSTFPALRAMVMDPSWPLIMRRGMLEGMRAMNSNDVGLLLMTLVADPELGDAATGFQLSYPKASSLPALKALIAHDQPAVRARAARLMQRWGAETQPVFDTAARHADPAMRAAMIETIAHHKLIGELDRVIHALEDADPGVRLTAVRALRATPERAPRIHGSLRTREPLAVVTLAWSDTPNVRAALTRALDAKSPGLCLEAVITLSSYHDPELVPAFIHAMKAPHARAREAAVAAVVALDPLMTQAAAPHLRRLAEHDPDHAVQTASRKALATHGKSTSVFNPKH